MFSVRASSIAQVGNSKTLHIRHNGIDVFRFVAIVGVIFIHANDNTALGSAFGLASRFSVPLFFILAGYFAAKKSDLTVAGSIRHVIKRIALPYVIWLGLYLVYFRYDVANFANLGEIIVLLVSGDPAYHLWFLPSLAFCTLMMIVLKRFCDLRALVGLAVVLYAGGLLIGPYARVFFSVADLGPNPRYGPCFGFPFMVLGYCMRLKGWKGGSFLVGALLYLGGFALTIGEVYKLRATLEWVELDLLLGTLPMGAGMFIMALKLPDLTATRPLAYLGQYSLGMFAVHLALMFEFQRLFVTKSFSSELAIVAFTVVSASIIAITLGQFRLTQPLVR